MHTFDAYSTSLACSNALLASPLGHPVSCTPIVQGHIRCKNGLVNTVIVFSWIIFITLFTGVTWRGRAAFHVALLLLWMCIASFSFANSSCQFAQTCLPKATHTDCTRKHKLSFVDAPFIYTKTVKTLALSFSFWRRCWKWKLLRMITQKWKLSTWKCQKRESVL